MNNQPLLTDPLSDAKTVCHICGKPHIHGPYDHERQLRINRDYRWQRIKNRIEDLIPKIAICVIIVIDVVGFIAWSHLPHDPPTPPDPRIEQIDSQMEKLQEERDEIDPPADYEPDPPDRY